MVVLQDSLFFVYSVMLHCLLNWGIYCLLGFQLSDLIKAVGFFLVFNLNIIASDFPLGASEG